MTRRRLRIFISYARSDEGKACELYERLINADVDAWIDKKNLLPGQDWELEIRRFIRKADVVVVCLSRKFNRAGYRQKEVRFALEVALEKPEGEIYIVPARLELCDSLESLAKWNWVDLFGDNGYENLFRALHERARKINAAMPKISKRGNLKTIPLKKEKNKTGSKKRKPKIVSNHTRLSQVSKNKAQNHPSNALNSSLVNRKAGKVKSLRRSASDGQATVGTSLKTERLVSDRVLKSWLNLHGLSSNPFGDPDPKSTPYYPKGAARPDRWEAFLDPTHLFALCPSSEDAQKLSYLLLSECLPLNKEDLETGINRFIFPLWVSSQSIDPLQSPFLTLARCAAQSWLDILPRNSSLVDRLSFARQNILMELLYWSFGSSSEIINLLQDKGLEEDAAGLSLIRKIEKHEKTSPAVPQDAVLLSWIKLRPSECNFTNLIVPLDEFSVSMRSSWLDQLSRFFQMLSMNGVIAKVISSTDLHHISSFDLIRLEWSNLQLGKSLDSQFDHAVEPSINSEGPKERKTRFIELFGSGAFGYAETEECTMGRLISASRNSLARMLTLGNCLLQHHCENRKKDGVLEKYLYTEDLETILRTA